MRPTVVVGLQATGIVLDVVVFAIPLPHSTQEFEDRIIRLDHRRMYI